MTHKVNKFAIYLLIDKIQPTIGTEKELQLPGHGGERMEFK